MDLVSGEISSPLDESAQDSGTLDEPVLVTVVRCVCGVCFWCFIVSFTEKRFEGSTGKVLVCRRPRKEQGSIA